MRSWYRFLFLAAVALLAANALNPSRQAQAADREAVDENLQVKVGDVRFTDAKGKTVDLNELKGKKAIVVVFLSFDCPVCTSYAGPLTEMSRAYADRGVKFVAVSTGEDEDAVAAARHAAEYKISFPVFADPKGLAVAALKAEVTPEVFLLDPNLVVRYRGRIDNAYYARLKRNAVTTRQDLQLALDEVLAGKEVSVPRTQAVGCSLRPEAPAAKETGNVTFYRDVLPVLQNNCQNCHRPGEIGPFPLMTYKQAVTWADDVKEFTQNRKMPPWKPTAGVAFQNERKMSEHEIATIARWVDGGMPAGESSDAPPPRHFTEGWQLGQPDLVLTPASDLVLGPSGKDLFRCYSLPTNLNEDKYVVAIEVKPGNPRIVHHTLNFIDAKQQGRKLEEAAQTKEKDLKATDYDRGPGYTVQMGTGLTPSGGLGGWAPGQLARTMPAGYGYFLPKGVDVVVQSHYHRDGLVEKDRLSIGLYFAKSNKGMQQFKGGVIPGRFFAIPANEDHYLVTGSIQVVQDCVLHTVMPHMHLLGHQIKVTVRPPEEKPITLVAINDWDYNWQETYFLKQPMPLKVGTTLDVEAIYDNSATNPNNPFNPPRMVTFGEQTTNEMCFVFLGATSEGLRRSPFGRVTPRAGGLSVPKSDSSQPDSKQKNTATSAGK
jgi:peroxiredoxin